MRTILLLLNTWAICGMEKLRLWGGQGPCDGRVEVFYNGEWGVICNHKWSIANEKVICRALGCGNPNVSPNEYSSTDPPKKVWMNEISCTGEEKNLWDCPFNGWGVSPCNYDTQHIIINCSETVVLSLSQECAGAVQVTNSRGKGYVCPTNWGSEEANVVCRQLNCGTSRVIPPKGLFTADGPTMISLLGCLGQEKHLWQCPKRTMVPCEVPHTPAAVICSNHHRLRLTGGPDLCSGSLEAEVDQNWKPVCQTNYTVTSLDKICSAMHCGTSRQQEPRSCNDSRTFNLTCSDTVKVVLLDGAKESRCFGTVHLNRNGKNEAVCYGDWIKLGASVICKELGCGSPVLVKPGEWTQDGHVNDFFCYGSESSIFHCMANYGQARGCNKAKIMCDSHVKVRLADGTGRCAGRVEILYWDKWMSVSSEQWEKKETNVACRNLNCGNGIEMDINLFSHGDSPVFHGKVSCRQDETALSHCLEESGKEQNLKTTIKVICQAHKTLYLQGEVACSGHVEIESNGTNFRLAASEETWNAQAAAAVCRQLDCGHLISFKQEPSYDGQTALLWMHTYNCTRNETSLFDCPHREENLTKHYKTAYVSCSGSISVNLSEECWGKVRVTTGGLHGAVCDDVWTQDHSRKLCQHLGCGTAVPMLKVKRIPGGVNIGSVYCAHKDSPLTQCKFIPNSRSSYCQDRPVYVTCSASIKSRIVDPKEKCSGNLELFHSSRWYPVCTKTLNGDLLNLVCRELGCGTALTGHSVALYTERSTQGLPSVKDCKGNFSSPTCNIEARLETCQQGHVHCFGWARMMLKDFNTCEGRVYVLTQAGLHSVSSQGWGDKEVQVLCKYLRCGNRTHHESTESSLKLWWKHTYDCSGKEKSIWQCETKEEPTVFQQLYISCTGNPIMKLNGTPGQCFGRVQVAASGLMRGVCAEQWDMKQSQVVCQEMSCSGAIGHDSEKDQALAYYFNCTGKESRLWQCSSEVSECNSALSLVCADSIKLRLSETCGGKIEILYGGIWKPVCPVTNRMAQEKICSELNCGKVISPKRKANQETRELDISLECNDSETFIKHCVHRKTCELKIPGEVYCERYVPGKENVVPVGTVVGVSLGLLLVVVAAVLIFWQRRHKRASRSRQVVRNTSVFESGDYEDIEPNMQEMLAPEVNISEETPAVDLEPTSCVLPPFFQKENDVGADRQDSEASSQSAYDDVEQESSDPTEPMLKEGHKFSSQKLTTENEVCGPTPEVRDVKPKLPEDYDDALASSSLKEPPGSQEHTGIGNCESGSTEEYIQPIE